MKESPKTLLIDTLLLGRGAMACDGVCYDSHHNVSIICCTKNLL